MREEDLSQIKQEAAKQTRMKEANQRKIRQMEEQKAEMDTQKEMLKAQISVLEKGTGAMLYKNHYPPMFPDISQKEFEFALYSVLEYFLTAFKCN